MYRARNHNQARHNRSASNNHAPRNRKVKGMASPTNRKGLPVMVRAKAVVAARATERNRKEK
jgi:hypothetical protein